MSLWSVYQWHLKNVSFHVFSPIIDVTSLESHVSHQFVKSSNRMYSCYCLSDSKTTFWNMLIKIRNTKWFSWKQTSNICIGKRVFVQLCNGCIIYDPCVLPIKLFDMSKTITHLQIIDRPMQNRNIALCLYCLFILSLFHFA